MILQDKNARGKGAAMQWRGTVTQGIFRATSSRVLHPDGTVSTWLAVDPPISRNLQTLIAWGYESVVE